MNRVNTILFPPFGNMVQPDLSPLMVTAIAPSTLGSTYSNFFSSVLGYIK